MISEALLSPQYWDLLPRVPPIPSPSILPDLKDWGLVRSGLSHYGLDLVSSL